MRALRLHTRATVGTRDDFQQVAIGVFEIDAAPIVPMVDLVRPMLVRIGQTSLSNIAEAFRSRESTKAEYERLVRSQFACDA